MKTLSWLVLVCALALTGCATYEGAPADDIEYNRGFGTSSGRMDDYQTYPPARGATPVIPPP
ncbi:MAG TPA: hypothetical protein GYA07_10820 [Verrucomicrobia bacterium]|nr:hypothetical protein [Verrucomicrobiota bacterium]HOB32980.1 hypothetical protein [Verrucomicrobiota bacterium]HOP98983.1 hypothetical protein [Verrucomicrobiota bacterium]HPU56703.1 hypothetical protein [Verrucomicrobiota bacterium]